MRHSFLLGIILALAIIALVACSTASTPPPTPTPIPPIPTLTVMLQTASPTLIPTSTPMPTPTAVGGGQGRIAFITAQNGSSEINLINADGTGLTHLAAISDTVYSIVWSTGGKEILFHHANDQKQVYLLNIDGSEPRLYASLPLDTLWAVWSPNFEKVAFARGASYTQTQMYVMDSNGSALLSLTHDSGNYTSANWSPDGTQLAFNAADRSFVIHVDGTRTITLPEDLSYHTYTPIWSPDGKRLALVGFSANALEIHRVNADGKGVQLLATLTIPTPFSYNAPVWSPDGQQIAIAIGNGDASSSTIYLIAADGSGSKHVIQNVGGNWFYTWSPDGRLGAFSSKQEGRRRIYLVNADGSNLRQLMNDAGDDYSPIWQP